MPRQGERIPSGTPCLWSPGRCPSGIDPAKSALELLDFFCNYKDRNPGRERLVFLGQPLIEIPARDDVVATGFVETEVRDAALVGATALVQPSYFESFSMALTEAWVHRKPELVQGQSDVLLGQAMRSRGAVPYRGFAEFETALSMVFDDPALAASLGAAGRRYVERNYSWSVVMDRYESLLDLAIARHRSASNRS